MSIEQKINGDNGILELGQEIDLDQSPVVRENIKELFEKCKSVSVDLAKVSYIDSSGIASLVEGMQTGKKTNKPFALINVSNEVMKVIKLAHLDKIFKIESQSGKDAGSAPAPETEVAPEETASDNIDMTGNEPAAAPVEETPSATITEEAPAAEPANENISPQVSRDDDGDDKIKFKR